MVDVSDDSYDCDDDNDENIGELFERLSNIPTSIPSIREEISKHKKKYSGPLTQYSQTEGGAFIATINTVKILPSDCYNLSVTQTGSVIFQPQQIVTDSLLHLPDSKSDAVISEVEKFWELKDKFKQFGFSHKRGFLLYGPPGSGKTSCTAMIISKMIEKKGTVFISHDPYILQKALSSFRQVEPNRPLVVVMEDIDSIIDQYGESCVLSILDGENQVENVVYIATTNYPEKLDGRIANRPSRFDKVVKIGMPNADARRMYLLSKLENVVNNGIDLVKETEGMSIAHIKELIIAIYCQESDVVETLDRLKKMKIRPKSEGDAIVGLG